MHLIRILKDFNLQFQAKENLVIGWAVPLLTIQSAWVNRVQITQSVNMWLKLVQFTKKSCFGPMIAACETYLRIAFDPIKDALVVTKTLQPLTSLF